MADRKEVEQLRKKSKIGGRSTRRGVKLIAIGILDWTRRPFGSGGTVCQVQRHLNNSLISETANVI